MDDAIIHDLGYVWSVCVYDDMQADPVPQITRNNVIKKISKATTMRDYASSISHYTDAYDETMESLMNYDL